MTNRRFRLAEHLLEAKPWTLFAMVEMGPDRMHHGFWKFMDPEHRKHEPGNPYETAILDYHRNVDGLIGKLLEHADEDTVVFVLSDHGAKRLDGGIRINEWLRREGLLTTLAEPNGVSSLRDVGVDWSRTTPGTRFRRRSTSRRSCTVTPRAWRPTSSWSSATSSGARWGRSAATRAS